MLHAFPVPAFKDNYLWVIDDGVYAIAVDPGDATPVIDYLAKNALTLSAILVTHHHADHTGGIKALLDWSAPNVVPVYAPATDPIGERTHAVGDLDCISIRQPDIALRVMSVPGHTIGHVAYYAPALRWVFCGDTLFAGGCGRMFEGTAPQMQTSLARLAALPPDTKVFCAHEYTLSNLKFASAVEPNNIALAARIERETKKRKLGKPTVPSDIALEQSTNPFLRWDVADVKRAAARANSIPGDGADLTPAQVFGALREWKNNF